MFIGIELDEEYFLLAKKRLNVSRQVWEAQRKKLCNTKRKRSAAISRNNVDNIEKIKTKVYEKSLDDYEELDYLATVLRPIDAFVNGYEELENLATVLTSVDDYEELEDLATVLSPLNVFQKE